MTSVARFKETISTHREAFAARGLDAGWNRIVSVVTQPGVDFGHSRVYPYDAEAASALSQSVISQDGLTFEAHSTDYQPTEALRQLVSDHFFFLKVGPELTFCFREAVFALSQIEDGLAPSTPSEIRDVIHRRMRENDGYWVDYYIGTEEEIAFQKRFSYSDRIRYYWTDPAVASALERLLANLAVTDLPAPIVSQFFGGFEFGKIPMTPYELIDIHVQKCVDRYFEASKD